MDMYSTSKYHTDMMCSTFIYEINANAHVICMKLAKFMQISCEYHAT